MKKLLFILLSNSAFSQITVTQFNADWNDANKVEWIDKLTDCDITKVDIVEEPKLQTKHEIVVVPTIIIFITTSIIWTERNYNPYNYRQLSTRNKVGIIC